MKKTSLLSLLIIVSSVCLAETALPERWTEKMSNEWDRIEVKIKSSADGSEQPAYFHFPPKARQSGGKVPLLVALHTWSCSYKTKNPAAFAATECCRRGWAFMYPHFRGPNNTPQGCGSDLALHPAKRQGHRSFVFCAQNGRNRPCKRKKLPRAQRKTVFFPRSSGSRLFQRRHLYACLPRRLPF